MIITRQSSVTANHRRIKEIFFFKIVLLFVVLGTGLYVTKNACFGSENQQLVIENYNSKKILWMGVVKEGDIIIYVHNHSVFGVEVQHQYIVEGNNELLLDSVKSLPFVLFSPYPGYGLQPEVLENNLQGTEEVKIKQRRNQIILAVGDDLTNKRFLIGNYEIRLKEQFPDASIIKVFLTLL